VSRGRDILCRRYLPVPLSPALSPWPPLTRSSAHRPIHEGGAIYLSLYRSPAAAAVFRKGSDTLSTPSGSSGPALFTCPFIRTKRCRNRPSRSRLLRRTTPARRSGRVQRGASPSIAGSSQPTAAPSGKGDPVGERRYLPVPLSLSPVAAAVFRKGTSTLLTLPSPLPSLAPPQLRALERIPQAATSTYPPPATTPEPRDQHPSRCGNGVGSRVRTLNSSRVPARAAGRDAPADRPD